MSIVPINTLSEYEQEDTLIDLIDELKSIKYSLDQCGFVATLLMFKIVTSANHNYTKVLVSRSQLLQKALDYFSYTSNKVTQWHYQVTVDNLHEVGLNKNDLIIGSCSPRLSQVKIRLHFINGTNSCLLSRY
jgi:hypothetical protein